MTTDQFTALVADVHWNQRVLQFIVALLFLTIAATIIVWWEVPYLLRKIGVLVGLAETNAALADHSRNCAVKAVKQATFEIKNSISTAATGLSVVAAETSNAAVAAATKSSDAAVAAANKVDEVIETLKSGSGALSQLDKRTN